MKAIASRAIESTGADAVTYGLADSFSGEGYAAWLASPGDEIVVAVDDDDLFEPNLRLVVEEFADDVQVVLWPHAQAGYGAKIWRNQDDLVFENALPHFGLTALPLVLPVNCALRKSFLRDKFEAETVGTMLTRHVRANEAIADLLRVSTNSVGLPGMRLLQHPSVKMIKRPFGLYNTHIGSITFLVSALKYKNPHEYLHGPRSALPGSYAGLGRCVFEFDSTAGGSLATCARRLLIVCCGQESSQDWEPRSRYEAVAPSNWRNATSNGHSTKLVSDSIDYDNREDAAWASGANSTLAERYFLTSSAIVRCETLRPDATLYIRCSLRRAMASIN